MHAGCGGCCAELGPGRDGREQARPRMGEVRMGSTGRVTVENARGQWVMK